MKNETIYAVWNKLNPNKAQRKRMLENVLNITESKERRGKVLKFKKTLSMAAFILAVTGTSFFCVYAAVPQFRIFIKSVFPLCTKESYIAIGEGHMTGDFDLQEVVSSFFDRFNKQEFGNQLTVPFRQGYRYESYEDSKKNPLIMIKSTDPSYTVVVYVKQIPYENTPGLWQVTGYEIMETGKADDLKAKLKTYVEEQLTQSEQGAKTEIVADSGTIKIYNAYDKQNVKTLSAEDMKTIRSCLDKAQTESTIHGDGVFSLVILMESKMYAMNAKGEGLIDENGNREGFKFDNQQDLKTILDLFKKYQVRDDLQSMK